MYIQVVAKDATPTTAQEHTMQTITSTQTKADLHAEAAWCRLNGYDPKAITEDDAADVAERVGGFVDSEHFEVGIGLADNGDDTYRIVLVPELRTDGDGGNDWDIVEL